jgi:hypothetical protein
MKTGGVQTCTLLAAVLCRALVGLGSYSGVFLKQLAHRKPSADGDCRTPQGRLTLRSTGTLKHSGTGWSWQSTCLRKSGVLCTQHCTAHTSTPIRK